MGAGSSYRRRQPLRKYMASSKVLSGGRRAAEGELTDQVSLWVKRITDFSSEYDSASWSANCVIGEPRVYPRYGDIGGAWAQGSCDSTQFIQCEFEEALHIDEIDIYETLNAGAVVKVSVQDEQGRWHETWSRARPEHHKHSRVFSPPLKTLDFPSKDVRLDVNCSACNTWCELDAVQIRGRRHLVAPPLPLTALSQDLAVLVNNPEFSDITFSVCGVTVHGHRALLAARSHYFRAMFTDGLKETNSKEAVVIPDISSAAFLSFMEYLYTHTLPSLAPLHLVNLIRVGDRFSDDGLKKLAYFRLCKEITTENVVRVWCESIEKIPVLDDVEECCIIFISRHMKEVTKTKAFTKLPQDSMLRLIQGTTARLHITN